MKPRFRDVSHRLRFVGRKQGDYDLTRFPDFLIVGPQRTGTTWLYHNLQQHPQVFIPEKKEIYYFSTLEYPEFHSPHLPPVDADLGWYLDHFRVSDAFAAARDRECRAEYGCPYEPRAFGEASATYAAGLREALIEEVLILNPEVKIIIMVRDPVERAWSHAKKDLCRERNRKAKQVAEAEWFEFIERPYQQKCGDFSAMLARWQKVVPRDQLMIGRYVDVASRPGDLLIRAYALLGIDADERFIPSIARARINPTDTSRIPRTVRARLEAMFGDEVARLRDADLI